jgi:hypothetical protein
MTRILVSCAILGALLLPAAALARVHGHAKPGFLVVRGASGDGGVNGHAVVTLVVHGFVLGSVSQEARVDIYQAPSAAGQGGPSVSSGDVSTKTKKWRTFTGKEYNGSSFRFRAMGGYYRVVVRGSGVYLFAGGHGNVTLQGSSFAPHADGKYSVDGGVFRSLPMKPLKREIGRG